MQLTATQALAYLGGLAAIVAIIANSIKIYEFAAPRIASYRKRVAAEKAVRPARLYLPHQFSASTFSFLPDFN